MIKFSLCVLLSKWNITTFSGRINFLRKITL
nr:MAG TPA: hypothetical protein [Caudoviricetes sp.]